MAVIAVGADHAGFALKQAVRARLIERGHQVIDFGTHSTDSVDYPDFAALVACAVREGVAERGVLVCGSGIGMAIAANKVAGIRAAVAADAETARLSRQHNDANVLSMGARIVLCDPHRAVIAGPSPLKGNVVDSPDIRAGMAMLLAALCAEGQSTIHNIGQIERGYERIDERLRAVGAELERLDD